MPPIAKENDTLTLPAAAPVSRAAGSAASSDVATKPQPVALEVPVTVNGARAVDGSDKREPFSESTKTILVFGNGAVIRLESSVAPGQLLFLTNERTKKEVVCQVVKSKNYRSVSGYVELEFTEPVVGFWGMRFPGDRIGPQAPVPAPGAKLPEAKPVAIGPAKPAVAPPAPKPPVPKPDATANFNALKSMISTPAPEAARASKLVEPPKSQFPAAPVSIETKSASPEPPKAMAPSAPATSDPATEALKQHTARLQEELSSMLFTETTTAKEPARSEPKSGAGPTDAGAKVLESAKANAVPPTSTKPEAETHSAVAAPPAPKTSSSSLEQDELKIPSWLAPLARNAANASPDEEMPAQSEALSEAPIFEEHIASAVPASSESSSAVEMPSFGGGLLSVDSSLSVPATSSGAGKGLKILAVAAGVLVAAAVGAWYVRSGQPAAPATVAASSTSANTRVSEPVSSSSNAYAASSAPASPAPVSSAPAKPANSAPGPTPAATRTVVPVPAREKAPEKTAAAERVRAQEEPKKASLGPVHLAAPTVNATVRTGSEAVPTVDLGGSEPAAETHLAGALASSAKQPAAPPAPIAVGGDVKQARLISSVPPLYPALAKTQRVSGDVVIDALIDAAGRVTTMKVVSGPTLLHQAAMDALRQWRYQPASLDGKPVPMHLTVSIQFRLQ